jgi:hypothetical protein
LVKLAPRFEQPAVAALGAGNDLLRIELASGLALSRRVRVALAIRRELALKPRPPPSLGRKLRRQLM